MVKAEWFAGRLREVRDSSGMTQEQLAQKAGLTKDGLAKIERGQRIPSWDTAVALMNALGVACTEFTKEPAEREAAGPGRPAKAEEPAANEVKKKPARRGK